MPNQVDESESESDNDEQNIDDHDDQPPQAVQVRLPSCRICMDREIEICALPCGHLVACGICWGQYSIQNANDLKCIMCREPVTHSNKAYFNF